MTEHLCTIDGCTDLNRHLDDCDSKRCRGCQPRICERGLVCNSCRTRIGAELAEIPHLHAQAETRDADTSGWTSRQRRPVPTTDPDELPRWVWVADGKDLTVVMPVGPVRISRQARVSGTREQPAIANLDLLDLTAEARHGSRAPHARGVLGDDDQTGYLSVATELDTWVRDWRDTLWPDHRLPVATVPELVRWLTNRLSDACDKHPGIDEFAADIRDIRSALRGVLGLNDAPKERCHGVACRSCDRMALVRDGTYVQCGYCRLYYSERDYREWVGLLAGQARRIAA